jgi:copper transport protein
VRLLTTAAALATVLALALLLPAAARAHALPQSSSPAERTSVGQPPRAVSITFTQRPDRSLSSIAVLDGSGRRVDRGPLRTAAADPRTLRVTVRPLRRGLYTVSWRVLSAADGHVASGTFAFGVGVSQARLEGAAAAPSLDAHAGSALAIVGHVLLYLGLVALVGAAAVGAFVLAAPPPRTARMLAACWGVAAIGTVALVEAARREVGVGPARLLDSSLGWAALERAAPLAVALAAIVAAGRTAGRLRRAMVALAGAGAAGAMLADADLSHAASGSAALLNIGAQWVHAVAVGFWLGGLAALLVALRLPGAETRRAVRRFSVGAGIALVAVVATGTARAIVEVGSWDRLLSTGFGKLVIVKAALALVLAVLGAANRLRSVPAVRTSLTGLRRIGGAELVVGAGAILAAAALVNLSPPASGVAAHRAAAIVAAGSDYGTTVRLRLEVSPGRTGMNRFVARLSDYDTGARVPAEGVRLRFAMPARPLLGESTLTLAPARDGSYGGAGANLALAGSWRISALVQRGLDSVEVPLTVRAARAAPHTMPGG